MPRAKRNLTIAYLLSESDPDARWQANAPVGVRDLRRLLIETGHGGAPS